MNTANLTPSPFPTGKGNQVRGENGFFKWDDWTVDKIQGFPINQGWWSRKYEYPWALQFAGPDLRVADMGCGWTPRPFKDALAKTCGYVYAVDGNEKVLLQPGYQNMEFVVADLTQRIEAIEEGSLDRVFCISVLEDVADKVPAALKEFGKCLKVGGLCVLTFDVQYDMLKPLGMYPGVKFEFFEALAEAAGLVLRDASPPKEPGLTAGPYGDDIDLDKTNAVYHEEFNLCVFHCVLVKS